MQESKKTGGLTVKRQLNSVWQQLAQYRHQTLTLFSGMSSRHIMKLMNMQPLDPRESKQEH